ncbi:MAG: hypothetical protein V9E89_06825 [Ilumatobacteraceae bacterium]
MPGNPLNDPNWAANLTSTVDRYVGLVRDNVTVKVVKGIRTLVFGVLASVGALVAGVLSLILGTRLLQKVSGRVFRADHATTVWISYLVVGGLLCVAGGLLMRSRHTQDV